MRTIQKPKKARPTPPVKWKKGECGNPNGRPKGRSISANLKKLTAKEFEEIIECSLRDNEKGLRDISNRPTASVLQKAVANSILRAMLYGDFDTVERIVERIIGKQAQKVDITTNGESINNQKIDLSQLSKEELIALKHLTEKVSKDETDPAKVH